MRQKISLWAIAVALICGTSVFTSCSSDIDDNPVDNNRLAEELVGKWLFVESDGEEVLTEEASVTTFVMEGSMLKAYFSISLKDYGLWVFKQPVAVSIDGTDVTLTMQADDMTVEEKMTGITVSGDELRYTSLHTTIMRDGQVIASWGPNQVRCTKVYNDYAPIMIGHWEGTFISDEPGALPETLCEDYYADGTSKEYVLVDGQWVVDETEYTEYFVDGNLLFTRWKYDGSEEERENCIIESFVGNTMILRQIVEEDGKRVTYTTTTKRSDLQL